MNNAEKADVELKIKMHPSYWKTRAAPWISISTMRIYIYIYRTPLFHTLGMKYLFRTRAHPPTAPGASRSEVSVFFFTRTPVFLALKFSPRPAHATRTSSEQLRFCVSRAVCDQAAPRRSPRPVRRVLEPLPPGCRQAAATRLRSTDGFQCAYSTLHHRM